MRENFFIFHLDDLRTPSIQYPKSSVEYDGLRWCREFNLILTDWYMETADEAAEIRRTGRESHRLQCTWTSDESQNSTGIGTKGKDCCYYWFPYATRSSDVIKN